MRAKKSLGQNFLVDGNHQRKLVELLGPRADEELVEIGPGRGALTDHLAGAVRRLVLVELDDELAGMLADRYRGRDDVRVRRGDILELPLSTLVDDPASARVLGNIPYNITSPILFHLLERPRPREIVLTVQREVAERVVAEPGSSAYGALAVGVRALATAELAFHVPRTAFRPVPRVDSAVLRVRPFHPPPLERLEEKRLRVVTRAAFQWRRKQLGKTLRDHPDLNLGREGAVAAAAEAGVDLTDRPERLSPERFIALARSAPVVARIRGTT